MQALALSALAVGTGLSTYQTIEEGKEAAKMSKVAQQQYNAEATATEQAGAYESREKRKEAARAKATGIANIYAGGGTPTGTNLLQLANTASEYEADALVTSRNYGLEALKLRNQGKLTAYQGRIARRASRIRATTGVATTIGAMYLMGGLGKGGAKTAGSPASRGGGAYGYTRGGGPTGGASRSMIG